MKKEMIELKDIRKSYGSLEVLRGVSLSVEPRRVTCIVGPSGAGKTTLLQVLGTLERPDSGSVVYDGEDVTRLPDRRLSAFRNRRIGFVFQSHQLLPEFTLQENVAMPALIAGVAKRQAMESAAQLLERLGLGQRMTHRPAELSGGEAQRGAVARALINNPAVVLADEPSGSLDTRNRRDLHRLFFHLRDSLGTTFVIVTHDEGLAEDADTVVHIVDGTITQVSRRAALVADPAQETTPAE